MPKRGACPVCGSKQVVLQEEDGLTYLLCHSCHFNESESYDEAYPGERSTQRGKTKHTPYKRGGGHRTRKTK